MNAEDSAKRYDFWASQPWGTHTIKQIAELTGFNVRTVRSWRSRLGGAAGQVSPHSTTPAGPPSPRTERSSRVIVPPTSEPPIISTSYASHNYAPSAHGDTSRATSHRILFIPDTHAPYHDRTAWRTMLAVAQMWRPTCLVILGDFLDLYTVSSHPKKPSVKLSLEDEIASGRECLDQLDALGVAHKYYIMGNHEARLQKHIAKHSPMFDGLLSVEELMSLEARGWEVTQYGDGRQLGELFVTHDLNIAGKYAVRRSMDAAWSSVIIGHTHRLEVVHQTDGRGRPVQGASFGWLGDFGAAEYMKKRIAARQWSHGLGVAHMDASGRADVTAVRILNGRCRVDGTEVTANDYSPSRTAA